MYQISEHIYSMHRCPGFVLSNQMFSFVPLGVPRCLLSMVCLTVCRTVVGGRTRRNDQAKCESHDYSYCKFFHS